MLRESYDIYDIFKVLYVYIQPRIFYVFQFNEHNETYDPASRPAGNLNCTINIVSSTIFEKPEVRRDP